jgi:hypothetical protein
MPGLSQMVGDLWNREPFVASTVPATYGAGAHNVLAITGGAVHILGIIEYNDTIIAGATTTVVGIGALPLNGASPGLAGALGDMVVSPMDVAGVILKIAPAPAVELPSLLGFAGGITGVVAAPGQNITWTFGGVAMGAAELVSLHVLYRKIHPQALIA